VEQIRKGMVVHSSDGERLGKVVAVRADTIIIEKGFFFPTDYTCRTSDIAEVRGEEVILRLARSQLEEAGSGTAQREVSEEERERNQPGSMPGGQGGMQRGQGGMQRGQGTASAGSSQEVRVPITEEQLEVEKRGRKAGEVRVSKRVSTEQKQVTVPVTREEVHVERVPAGRPAREGEGQFAQQNVTVPVMEEEVVVNKRPVVREEVRISKESRQEQRPVSAQVRREEAEIEQDRDGDSTNRPYKDDPDASHP
jgi:uncharacterized protein (TIGR02271 family)